MVLPWRERPARCEGCPRRCGVNRLVGEVGFCGIGGEALVSHAGLHFGEEPPLSGTRGSGTIFFAGCNLRCVFCQNHQISQEFRKTRTRSLSPEELASVMLSLQVEGAHNINFVSPSHVLFPMAGAIEIARRKGFCLPVVYNSNGYDSVDALRAIRGLVDIYLPDLKYMESEPAGRFSGAADYPDVAKEVLREMLDQVGHLETDGDGIALRGLLVRHLVLPGCLDNTRRSLRFLAELSPRTAVSIMSQYSPQYRAFEHAEIDRSLTEEEYMEAIACARDLGLENAFVQERESRSVWLPDFAREHPFEESSFRPSSGGAGG